MGEEFKITEARIEEKFVFIRLKGELDLSNCWKLERMNRALLDKTASRKSFILELSNLSFIDSSGIRVIICLIKELSKNDAKVELRNPIQSVSRVMKIVQLDELLEITHEGVPYQRPERTRQND